MEVMEGERKSEEGSGGYLLKFLIIDDGWQETVNELHKEVIPNDVVALKIQKPSFPWEFYMYHQLDKCISKKKLVFVVMMKEITMSAMLRYDGSLSFFLILALCARYPHDSKEEVSLGVVLVVEGYRCLVG
ncbi:hypothetical protein L1049_013344 [Liquidambar formosana]|uniref:Uncharacterized protein n=1 Tax=Liquidambar formosana TaxID=63359 RepID=A0AAP0RNA0_LIQFO